MSNYKNILNDFLKFKTFLNNNFELEQIPFLYHNPADNLLTYQKESIILSSCKPIKDNNFSFLFFSPLLKITLTKNIFFYKNFLSNNSFKIKICKSYKQVDFLKNFIFTSNKIPKKYLFTGGWVGYFSYDWGAKLYIKGQKTQKYFPEIYLLFYPQYFFYNLIIKNCCLINILKNNFNSKKILNEIKLTNKFNFTNNLKILKLIPQINKNIFKRKIVKCQKYIVAGDIYQANLSWQFQIKIKNVSPLNIFKSIIKTNPSPFSSFLNLSNFFIISNSPERLINKKDNLISTRPIAGTYPRGKTKQQDKILAAELLLNSKERAEHLMLVDLARNDLGKVSKYKSLKVSELFNLETYQSVFHITSNVIGKVKNNTHLLDIFLAIFPGGTITGCPKKRALEIIWELEKSPRGIYTGSIGYFSLNGNMDFNIAIRTLITKKNMGYLQIGSGIVYDSNPQKEYEETIHKASSFLKILKK